MKHIFTIHSPITFLISLAIIEYKHIKKADVVFLSRSYKVPLNNFTVLKSFSERNNNIFKKLLNINAPKSIDKYIKNNLNDEEFILYADLMNHENRVLITNNKCKGFNFIEEGMASYVSSDSLEYFTINESKIPYRIHFPKDIKAVIKGINRVIRGYSTRISALPINPSTYTFFKEVQFYSFSEDCFPHAMKDKKHVIDFSFIKPYNHLLSNHISLKNEIIWIDDSFAKSFNIDVNIYYKAIDAFLKLFNKKSSCVGNRVYIKMRPDAQNNSMSFLTDKLVANGYTFSILPNDIIIESLLLNSDNCTVIGGVSSTLYYANLMNHISYSIFNHFNTKNRYIFDDLDCYWNRVKTI